MEADTLGLRGIVDQLTACGYECEAGRLEDNTAFQRLVELASYETDGMEIIRVSSDGRYIFEIEPMDAGSVARLHDLLTELFKGERPFIITRTMPNKMRVLEIDRGERSLPQPDRDYLRTLADAMEAAPRQGADTDEPEGVRYITLSETVTNSAVRHLREIAERETA